MTDFSQLVQPMAPGLDTIDMLFEAANAVPAEDRKFIKECIVALECRHCRNMFRSLHNLIAHKKKYCVQLHAAVVHANGGEIEEGSDEQEETPVMKKSAQQRKREKAEKAKEKENVVARNNESKESTEGAEETDDTPREEPATLDLFSQSRATREAPLMKMPDGTKKVVGTLPCHLARLDKLSPSRTPIALPQDNLSRYQTMERLTAQDSSQARKCSPGELKIMENLEEKDIRCANIDTNECEHPSCEKILPFHSLEALAFHCTLYHSEPSKNEEGEERWTCLLCNREVESLESHLKKSHSKVKDEHMRRRREEMKKDGKGREEVASYRSRSLSIDPNAKIAVQEEEAEKTYQEDPEDDDVLITAVIVNSQEEKKIELEAKKGKTADKNERDNKVEEAGPSTSKMSDQSQKDKDSVEEKKKEIFAQIPPQSTSSVQVKKQAQLSNVISRITAKVSPPPSVRPSTDEVDVTDIVHESNLSQKKKTDGESGDNKVDEVLTSKKSEVHPAESRAKREDIAKPAVQWRKEGGFESIKYLKTTVNAKVKSSDEKEEKPADKKEENEMARHSRMPSKSGESSAETEKKDDQRGKKNEGKGKVVITEQAQPNAIVSNEKGETTIGADKKEEKEVVGTMTRRSRMSSKSDEGSSADAEKKDDGKDNESKEKVITDPTQLNGIVSKETDETTTEAIANTLVKKTKYGDKEKGDVCGRRPRRPQVYSMSGEGTSTDAEKNDDVNEKDQMKVSFSDPSQVNGVSSNETERATAEAISDKKVEISTDKKDDKSIEKKEETTDKKEEKEVVGTMTRRSRVSSKQGEGSSIETVNKDEEQKKKDVSNEKVTIPDPTQVNGVVSKEAEKIMTDANAKSSEKKDDKSAKKVEENELIGMVTRRSRMSVNKGGSSTQTERQDDGQEKGSNEKVTISGPSDISGVESPEQRKKVVTKAGTTPRRKNMTEAVEEEKTQGTGREEQKDKEPTTVLIGGMESRDPRRKVVQKAQTTPRRMKMAEAVEENTEEEKDKTGEEETLKEPITPRVGRPKKEEAGSSKAKGEKNEKSEMAKTPKRMPSNGRPSKRKAENEAGSSKDGEKKTNGDAEVKKEEDDQTEEPKTPKIGRPRKSDETGSSKKKKAAEKVDGAVKEELDEKEETTPKIGRPRKSLNKSESSAKKDDGEKEEIEVVKRKRGRPSKDKKTDEIDKVIKEEVVTEDEEEKEEVKTDNSETGQMLTSSGRVRKRPHWMTNGDYEGEQKKKETNGQLIANGVDRAGSSKDIAQPAGKKVKKEKDDGDQAGTSQDILPSTSQITPQGPTRREPVRGRFSQK